MPKIEDIHSDTELSDVARLFYGDEFPCISLDNDGNRFTVIVNGSERVFDYSDVRYDAIPDDRRVARLSKIAVYDALSAVFNADMPWGALTGVRPTKLFYELMRGGKTIEQAKTAMREVYRVSEKRAHILEQIIVAQSGKVEYSPEYYNLYVHVPFCTTRCTYCSFVSLPIAKHKSLATAYVDYLCDEIRRSVAALTARGKKILSVYIGGGTPSALDDADFDKLLSAVGEYGCEYTCEAGRPDTVSEQKADVMKAHGVTRVCVNPQTLNEKTLELIGRSHSAKDFYRAYDIIRSRGFDINCDLIAGLYGENTDDFINSFNGIISLKPQNFTVHSLSVKNGSAIRYEGGENRATGEMTEYALNNLGDYTPYYLYRQKRQSGNLENIGFCLRGKECVNNITVMEETVGVMACGSGAISKFVNDGAIVRFANIRDVALYISRYEEKISAKLAAFDSMCK